MNNYKQKDLKVKTKISIEDKIRKDNPEFVSEVERLDAPALEKRLSDLAKGAEDVEDAKEADESLEQAKAQATELGAPYRDAKKSIRLKMRYIINILKERGSV